MTRSTQRIFLSTLALVAIVCIGLTTATAQSTGVHSFDIPAEDLGKALTDLGQQAEREIVFSAEATRGKHSARLQGTFTLEQALDKLLTGTGLSYRSTPGGPIAIDGPRVPTGSNESNSTSEGPASSSLRSKDQLQEVIVTAQKRNERLQDVPVPVAAVNTQTLTQNNQLRLQDFYMTVPGLTVGPSGDQSNQELSIRGITTGLTNPTVGITIDDMPIGGSTLLGASNVVPDIDPGDLARIEVLRGPQGTLYGASSLGGLIKFVTVDPSLDGFSGRIEAGASEVNHGDTAGYNFRAAANVPLGDTIALRASGFTHLDPGYIDNIATGQRAINEQRVSGGRLSALWRPTDAVSLKVSAQIQETKGDAYNLADVQPGLGVLEQDYARSTGVYDRKLQAYSAVFKAKFGSADLTAISGYNVSRNTDTIDYSVILGGYFQTVFGVSGAPVLDSLETKKFTEEVRLSTPVGEKAEWLVGGYYSHESSEIDQNLLAANRNTGIAVANLYLGVTPTTFAEYAAFTDLTYKFTDQFDVQIGGRESRIKQTVSEVQTGPFTPALTNGHPSPDITPEADATANAFTYLLTPRFKVSPDFMLYARLASGYRAGGANDGAGGVPPKYDPDKTRNYELGFKGDLANHIVSIDASVYYIDWKNIQVSLVNAANFTYIANAGSAKSQGVELTVQARPLPGLTVAGWVAYNDAELTANLPPHGSLYGVSGDRLPFAAHFTSNFTVDQEFPLSSALTGFVGGAVSYVGQRESYFTGSAQRTSLPTFAKTDFRTGVKYDLWTANLFVNNVTDRRGIVGMELGTPLAFTYLQPRTVGLNIVRQF